MLWAYGIADLAQQLLLSPLELARLIAAGDLDPLSLIEVAGARRHGLAWLRANKEELLRFRVPEVVELRTVVPSPLDPPPGLGQSWAWSYKDLFAITGKRPAAVWAAGLRRAWHEQSGLKSVLDYLDQQVHVWAALASTEPSA